MSLKFWVTRSCHPVSPELGAKVVDKLRISLQMEGRLRNHWYPYRRFLCSFSKQKHINHNNDNWKKKQERQSQIKKYSKILNILKFTNLNKSQKIKLILNILLSINAYPHVNRFACFVWYLQHVITSVRSLHYFLIFHSLTVMPSLLSHR